MSTVGSERARPGKGMLRPNTMILRRTLILMTMCGVVAFAVLVWKLYQIQIVKHDYYERLAVEQQTRQSVVTASRGTIYDRNGNVLAMSASVETVFISPYEMNLYKEDKELIASKLSEILGVDRQGILAKMEDTKSWYKTVKTKIESDVAAQVRQFIKEHKIKSVHLEPDSKRYYPYGTLASHVLGFVGTENKGLEGLELKYNSYLEGRNGRIIRLKNAKGTDMLFTDYEDYFDAQDGKDITLTIDSTIQFYIEKYLAQAIKDYDVQNGGACIAVRPTTGEILGLASYGNFDPNNYLVISAEKQEELSAITDEDEYSEQLRLARLEQWRNKAIADTYEPGSVFKIITLSMALEENVVNPSDTFYCGGSVPVLGRTTPVKCWKTQGHGSQTLKQALQHSCNVAIVNIGLRVGAEKFYEYVDAFGFFDKTGVDLPGESGSIWWPKKTFEDKKNLSQLAAASFGQTFNITPMQLIMAVSATVNGGKLMKPYIVKEIANPADGSVEVVNQPTVLRQVISENTSRQVREILESIVGEDEGTGKNAYVPGYRIGGKTGTSEKVAQDLQNEGAKEYIVSFLGIAPMDDPQIAVLLILDNPSHKSGIYISGGNMAAPVVGNILSEVLPYLGVEPVYTEEEKAVLDVSVPKVTGRTVDEAKALLREQGLNFKVVGDGDTVTDQLPGANAAVSPGSQIIIYAGAEKPAGTVTVPNLYGKRLSEVRAQLESLGLYVRSSGALVKSDRAVVNTQSIPSGEEVAAGTVIRVTLVDPTILGFY
jgi:stage V sporulation protein D (sporulation-specific penicillin-binding protein)